MIGIRNYIFDIETVPLPTEQWLDNAEPFSPPSNIKDPAKIEARRLEHQNRVTERAALNPLSAEIAVIGIKGPARADSILLIGSEADIIKNFFERFEAEGINQWIGFNIAAFDVPFIMRRAWALGIDLPTKRLLVKGRRLSHWCIDLVELWKACTFEKDFPSLDRLGRFLGVGSKEHSGANFQSLLYESKEAALAYVENDLELTWRLAERFGVIGQAPNPAQIFRPEETEVEFY